MLHEFVTHPEQVAIFKAQCLFARKTSGVNGPYRNLGITPKAELQSLNKDVAEVVDPRRFDGLPYKRITKKITPAFGVDLHEVNMENLALCLDGVVDEITQAGTEIADEPLGETGNRGIFVGAIYKLANPHVDTTETFTLETDEASPVAFTLDTHFTLDAVNGLVEIIAIPATATVGDPVRATYTPVAKTIGSGLKRIKASSEARVEGRLMLIGESGEGEQLQVNVWNCYVELDGGMQFYNEDPQKYSLKVTVLSDEDHTEPFEVIQLAAATA